MTERVSPRIFRVVARPAPTEREKSQMYAERDIPHLPAAGEVMIFDRSWYNRAGVERVMGSPQSLAAVPSTGRTRSAKVVSISSTQPTKATSLQWVASALRLDTFAKLPDGQDAQE